MLVGLAVTAGLLFIAQDQETLRVENPVAASDARFADYVGSLVGAAVHRGNAFTVLRNGDESFPAMLEAIGQAKARISVETYIYEDGVAGDQFTRALVDAARRGVTVRIVLDGVGAKLSDQSQKTLTDAGAAVVWFNPVRPWTIEETNYRTHRKVLVVDGDVGFTGGIGLADHWVGNADREEHWRDTQIKAAGPVVRALEASFYENWLESGGRSVPALDPDRPAQGTEAGAIVVWSNPTAGVSNVKLLYLLSIAGARTTLDIQSPYFMLDESTRFALEQARRRGVRVRILNEGDITDAKPVKLASREGYEDLLEAGHEIFEYQPTMMHAKALVVDGIWSIVGSANFDNRSFELNDEVTMAVSDRGFAAALTRDFEADLARAKKLTLEEWKRRGIVERSLEFFWSWFGEVF